MTGGARRGIEKKEKPLPRAGADLLSRMFYPVRWKTFLRDLARIELGLGMFGFAIALMIRANLGTSAWAVLEVALARIFGLSPGTMTVIDGFVILGIALALREKVGWGTLANILSVGPWEDLALFLIPPVRDNLVLQIAMFALAIATMGLASAIYIGVGAGAGPRDSLMLAIKRKLGLSIRISRGSIEIVVVTAGWLLGGPAGVGTIVYALLIGISVQLGFKLFKVDPHRARPEEGADSGGEETDA